MYPNFKARLLLLWFLLGSSAGLMGLVKTASAQVLMIEASDQHSAYDQLPAFLDQLHEVVLRFKEKFPSGKVVLLINGDFSGASIWSGGDRGWLGYQVLKELNNEMQVVFVPGNHDGLDWGKSERGNELFQKQMEFLRDSGIPVLAANIKPGPSGKKLFSKYYDLDGKIRIAGFALETMKQQSGYDSSAKVLAIERVNDPVNDILEILKQARKDRISKLVLAFHESTPAVEAILKQVVKRDRSAKSLISTVFAAHDHNPWMGISSELPLYNGGGDFDYAHVELSDDGKIQDSKLSHPIKRAEGSETALAKTVDRYVKARQAQEMVPWVEIQGYEDTRATFVQGRTVLGTRLADALSDWARNESRKTAGNADLPVVSLYNSSAYRLNTALPEGALSRGDIKKLYPFTNFAKSVRVSGKELQESFIELKTYAREKLNMFTPQLSSNLRETVDGKLEFLHANRTWKPLVDDQFYNVAMDAWLSENGFKLSHWNWVNEPSRILASRAHQDVLVDYAPARLGQLLPAASKSTSCGNAVKDSLSALGALAGHFGH